MSLLRNGIYLSVLFLVSACSTAKSKSPDPVTVEKVHNYNVSVSTDGKPVNDFDKRLVHDVVVPAGALAAIGKYQSSLEVVFVSEPELDLRGSVVGVRLLGSRSGLDPMTTFGWLKNDVITAVGLRHVRRVADLGALITQLQQQQAATLTLIRDGAPHKILYTVRRNS